MTINANRELILLKYNTFVLAFLLWCSTFKNLLFFYEFNYSVLKTREIMLALTMIKKYRWWTVSIKLIIQDEVKNKFTFFFFLKMFTDLSDISKTVKA